MCGSDTEATIRLLADVDIRDLNCDVNQIPGRKEKGGSPPGPARLHSPASEAGSLSAVTVGWVKRDEGRAGGGLRGSATTSACSAAAGCPWRSCSTWARSRDRPRYYEASIHRR
jgi:hypothetical protein